MRTDLKTCPFCEGEARLRPWIGQDGIWQDLAWVVRCENCGCQTWPCGDPNVAVTRWNRRPQDEDELPKGCFNCDYSRQGYQTLRCFGQ